MSAAALIRGKAEQTSSSSSNTTMSMCFVLASGAWHVLLQNAHTGRRSLLTLSYRRCPSVLEVAMQQGMNCICKVCA